MTIMASERTVIVVGAGASKEVELPTGAELKNIIASRLDIRFDGNRLVNGDRAIWAALEIAGRQESRNIDELQSAAWRIRDAMAQASSIDSFVDSHRDDPMIARVAKIAIVDQILAAERQSKLRHADVRDRSRWINFGDTQDTWFNKLIQLVTENCTQGDLEDRFRELTFVVFNYDRCIEHYLHTALQNFFGIDHSGATAIVNGISIYHPYGSVGQLPWQNPTDSIEFGDAPNASRLYSLSDQIKTFAEGTDPDQSEIAEIRQALSNCSRTVFLGFAFHQMNLELLAPPVKNESCNSIFATTMGISSYDQQKIQKAICRHLVTPDCEFNFLANDKGCVKLFDEYRRGLSLQ